MNNTLETIVNLGKEENIKDRWSLKLQYPTPLQNEAAAFERINAFTAISPTVKTSGINVQLGRHIDAYIAYLMCCDAYEHGDINLIKNHASRVQKAVVIGGGIGVIACALAKYTGAYTIVYEANELLIPHIHKTAALNDVSLDVRLGLIARTSGNKVKFHISSEFWASSANEKTYKKDKTIEVTSLSFNESLLGAQTAFIDIEGTEVDLFFDAPPPSLKEIFIEIHTPSIGTSEASKIMNRIWAHGFKLIDQQGLTSFWRK